MKLNILLILSTVLMLSSSCEKECVKPERCTLEPQVDICYAAIPRYYFDKEENRCKEYIWGGCIEYPFETMEECQECECN